MTNEYLTSTHSRIYQLQIKPEAGCPGAVKQEYSQKTQDFFDKEIYEANQRSLPPVWRIKNLCTGEIVYSSCPECKDSEEGNCSKCPKWQKELPKMAELAINY